MVTFLPLELNLTMIILGETGLHSGNNFSADSLSINATSSRCTCCCYVEYPLSSCKCNLFCFILLAEMLYCHISLATRATRLSCRVRAFQVPILFLPFNVNAWLSVGWHQMVSYGSRPLLESDQLLQKSFAFFL